MDLSLLSLFPATPEQVLESRRRTFEQWGKGLSLSQYLERDAETEQSECGRDGKFITWVLVPRVDSRTPDFICSCETFHRRGLIRTASGITDATCYGIASVFTPLHHRRKGYARHMMRLLHWVLAPESYLPSSKFPGEWGMPPERTLAGDANCSILYSDVGSDFYHLCGPTTSEHGWVVDKPLSTEWNVSEWVKSAQGANKQWIWLDNRTLIESWKADARKIEEELSTHLGNETIFTFLPDRGVAEFQYQRSKGLWSQLEPLPVYWGICSTTSEVGLDDAHVTNEIVYNSQVAYATWAFGYSQEVVQGLIITRLRATKEGFPQLLERIIDYAKGYGLSKVEIWNLAPDFKEFAIQTGGRTYSLEEHLPAIKWYGAGGAKWVLNEKFCWC